MAKKPIISLVLVFCFSSLIFPAISFDNVDDFIEVADDNLLDITGDITISAWIRRNGTNQDDPIIAKSNRSDSWDYELFFRVGNDLLTFYSDATDDQVATGSITDNNWHHVGFTRLGSGITFYIDGVAAGTTTAGTAFTTSTDPLFIGTDETASGFFLNGDLSEVCLWSAAASAAEMAKLATSQQKRLPFQILTPSDRVVYFPMDEVAQGITGDAVVFRDLFNGLTGTGNDGANDTGLTGEGEILSYPGN